MKIKSLIVSMIFMLLLGFTACGGGGGGSDGSGLDVQTGDILINIPGDKVGVDNE